MAIDNRKDLIHQLYAEFSGETEEAKENRYIRSTGTLYGNPERFEKEKEEKLQKNKKEVDPWSMLVSNPSDIR